MSDPVNRREFLTAVTVAAAATSLPVLQASARTRPIPPDAPVDVGTLADYPKDGVTSTWARKAAFFVVRDKGKLFAVSSVCTHKYCYVAPDKDGFFCKCHRSSFTIDGEVTDGPAPTSLPHYGVHVDDKGHVIVELKKEFAEAKWEDPASFIKV